MSRNGSALNSDAYDNPVTMRREHRIGSVSAALLLTKGFKGGKWFPVELNTGPFRFLIDTTKENT